MIFCKMLCYQMIVYSKGFSMIYDNLLYGLYIQASNAVQNWCALFFDSFWAIFEHIRGRKQKHRTGLLNGIEDGIIWNLNIIIHLFKAFYIHPNQNIIHFLIFGVPQGHFMICGHSQSGAQFCSKVDILCDAPIFARP